MIRTWTILLCALCTAAFVVIVIIAAVGLVTGRGLSFEVSGRRYDLHVGGAIPVVQFSGLQIPHGVGSAAAQRALVNGMPVRRSRTTFLGIELVSGRKRLENRPTSATIDYWSCQASILHLAAITLFVPLVYLGIMLVRRWSAAGTRRGFLLTEGNKAQETEKGTFTLNKGECPL